MKELSRIAEQEAKKMPEIKLRLGSDLVKKIDDITEKYDGLGVKVRAVLGATGGYFLLYNLLSYLQPLEEPKQLGARLISTFLGIVFGANAGLALGRTYGIRKIKQLKKDRPDVSKEIDDYNNIRFIQTYNNIRP